MTAATLAPGDRFGWLTVLGPTQERYASKPHHVCVEVECDCGTRKIAKRSDLRGGRVVSCGCKKGNRQAPALTKRGTRLASKYRMTQKGADERGIEFHLPRAAYDAMLAQPCAYCGSPATGVDRIDSAKPYTEANCQPMCKVCNIAKGSQSEARFYAWVRHVYLGMSKRLGVAP